MPPRVTRLADLGGIPAITVAIAVRGSDEPVAAWPYQALDRDTAVTDVQSGEATMVPYFAWANCGDGAMRVWIPRAG